MTHQINPLPSLANSAIHRNRAILARIVHRWLHAATRQWERQRTMAALEALSDRLLEDIGIRRSDIRRVVYSLSDRELNLAPLEPSAISVEIDEDFYQEAA